MGLRKFSLRAFLKKNFDFIVGILGEIGLAAAIMVVALLISIVLALIKAGP
ncbi:MAG: hypothetical protein AB1476_05165 [Candidatus Hadarchaeota archaeon]